MSTRRHLTRAQLANIVHGVICFILGGDSSVVWPALGASAVCLLLNLGLLRYLSSAK